MGGLASLPGHDYQFITAMISLINNDSVRNGNADYWARLGVILKENKEMGISNAIYADLALPVNNGAFFRQMIEPEVKYFNMTGKED